MHVARLVSSYREELCRHRMVAGLGNPPNVDLMKKTKILVPGAGAKKYYITAKKAVGFGCVLG